ncbi:MAG: nucleoside-diphosphate kinase [Theionarchaea archaeon]|nr:nucleoside-diphosphate kinase [Theionarchaea archaeon]
MEKTFVMIKPDGVKRGLIGQVIARFERAGLKLIGLKMVHPTKEMVEKHYPSTEKWFTTVGEKTLSSYKEMGLDPKEHLGTDSALEIGKIVKGWLLDFISSSPVVCMVWEGNHAIQNVRRLVGNTLPIKANPGTIRGDFTCDSPDLANKKHRPIRNIVHASGDSEEAGHEISLWFTQKEIHDYQRVDAEIMLG